MIIVLVSIVISQIFFVEDERVTPEIMKKYVEEYFSYYKYLDDGNNVPIIELGITDLSNFTFGFRSYDTSVVISTSHGAALFFSLSERDHSEITFKKITNPIEYYLWPQMAKNIDALPSIGIKKGEYNLDSVVTVHDSIMYVEPGATVRCVFKDRPLNITNTGAVLFFGNYILEHSILLKGSNNREDWTNTQADLDALSEYLWDCKSTGMNDTLIQSIENKYKPSILLEKIASRMKQGDYKDNQALFNSDYEELERVSNDSINDMLTKILDDFYALQQESTPGLFEQIVNYLFTKADAIIIGVVISISSLLLGNYLTSRGKKKKKQRKR